MRKFTLRKLNKLVSLGLGCAAALFTANASATDLSQKSWQEIEAQAKKEGEVIVSIWYLQPQFRTFVKTFETQYGIKVRIPEGTADGNINKLLAEKNLKQGKMDVVAVGTDLYPTVQKSGALMDLSKLPSFEKGNHVLQGVEFGNHALGFWGNQTGFAYDPQRLTEDQLPQSWQDFENYLEKQPRSTTQTE